MDYDTEIVFMSLMFDSWSTTKESSSLPSLMKPSVSPMGLHTLHRYLPSWLKPSVSPMGLHTLHRYLPSRLKPSVLPMGPGATHITQIPNEPTEPFCVTDRARGYTHYTDTYRADWSPLCHRWGPGLHTFHRYLPSRLKPSVSPIGLHTLHRYLPSRLKPSVSPMGPRGYTHYMDTYQADWSPLCHRWGYTHYTDTYRADWSPLCHRWGPGATHITQIPTEQAEALCVTNGATHITRIPTEPTEALCVTNGTRGYTHYTDTVHSPFHGQVLRHRLWK